jgi:hypothetical protein
MYMIVHFRTWVGWNLVALGLFPYDGFRTLEWLYLVLSVEDEWLIAARDTAPSHDGGSMWFVLVIGFDLW